MSAAGIPFVDAHLHVNLEHMDDFVRLFDELGLCGAWNIANDPGAHAGAGERDFDEMLEETEKRYGNFVHTIYWPRYDELTDPSFPKRCATRIDELAARGIVGVKVWKDMGLGIKDPQGKLMMLDDERLNPIWEKTIERGLLLIAHVADPATFWLPMDESNPSYKMLKRFPEWHFGKPGLPSREELFEARDRLHKRYPELTIVNSHCGGYAESLAQLTAWMDEMPNFHATIGRHHVKEEGESVKTLLRKHPDRIMFETDLGMRRGKPMDEEWVREAYSRGIGGFRVLFGACSRETFEQFAHTNAERLIRQVKAH